MQLIFIGAAIGLTSLGILGGVGLMKGQIEAGKGTKLAAEAIGKAAGFALIAGTAIYLIGKSRK
jgi:hypothetical protein